MHKLIRKGVYIYEGERVLTEEVPPYPLWQGIVIKEMVQVRF